MTENIFLQRLTAPFYRVKSDAERFAEKVVKTSLVKDDCGPFQFYSVHIGLGSAVDKNVEVEARRAPSELYVRYIVRETLRLVLESILRSEILFSKRWLEKQQKVKNDGD